MGDQKKIKTWLKLEEHFVDQDNVRSVMRFGGKTRIERILGEPILVDIDYDKVVAMLPQNEQ